MAEQPKGRGGKLSRSETVTVRLDPKLRYLAELAALKHRRTLSSFIEWAIEDTLNRVKLKEGSGYNNEGVTVADEAPTLWDVDDADRFAKLALRYPDLLTHEEQKRWKLIRENGFVWRGRYDTSGEWEWKIDEGKLNFERLREHWEDFCAVARGERDVSTLPRVASEKETKQQPSKSSDDFDDDIPF